MALPATQAMLSVTLLVGAGLFVRSLLAVQYSSLGYDPSRVLVVNRHIPPGGFDAVQQTALREHLLETARAPPDVESAAWMSSAPFVSTSWTHIHVPDLPNATSLGPFTFQATTADYFRTMGTRILRGRGLLAGSSPSAPCFRSPPRPPARRRRRPPVADVVVDWQASWRIGAAILAGFGALALIVAGVGLFGSVRYDIAQRSREWAVRVALGAGRPAIVRLIVSRSLGPVLMGVIPGLLVAAAFGWWVQPLLYRTSAFDPLSFVVAAGLMFVVAIAASVCRR